MRLRRRKPEPRNAGDRSKFLASVAYHAEQAERHALIARGLLLVDALSSGEGSGLRAASQTRDARAAEEAHGSNSSPENS